MFACLLLGFPMFMCMVLSSTVVIFAYLDMLPETTIISQLMEGIGSFALLAI
ncbi:MAG: TRAP transporter large permease subunit, partial [Anaerovoracaceae bacterium]